MARLGDLLQSMASSLGVSATAAPLHCNKCNHYRHGDRDPNDQHVGQRDEPKLPGAPSSSVGEETPRSGYSSIAIPYSVYAPDVTNEEADALPRAARSR